MIHHQWNTKLNRETSFLIKSNNPIHSQGNQKFIVDSLSSSKSTPNGDGFHQQIINTNE